MNIPSTINFQDSINSGQVFLWEKYDKKWYGINGHDVIMVNEKTQHLDSLTSEPMDIFRKDDNFKKILKSITKDELVQSAVKKFPGLRLLRQDPFQCYITFIVSSNANIQKIKQILKSLCRKFGKKVRFDGKEFFLFPEPKRLALADTKDLLDCSLGYRAKSVKKASNDVVSGEIDFDFLKKTNYEIAKDSLLKVYGIGNKVADCILLFSLEKLDAFPLDRWMLRIIQKYYFDKFQTNGKTLTEKKYQSLRNDLVNHFGPYAGYSQQFLFKMERDLYQKKWL
jgi:N-glycosylase/DNA lyase